jgi:hypothetical protein
LLLPIAKSLQNLAKQNMRPIVMKVLTDLIQLMNSFISEQTIMNENFCSILLEFLTSIIKSGILEKQLRAFDLISHMCSKKEYISCYVEFFREKEHQQILNLNENHPECAEKIGTIFTILLPYSIFPLEFLQQLWSLHSVQHESDMYKFYKFFSKLLSVIPFDILGSLISLISSVQNISEP